MDRAASRALVAHAHSPADEHAAGCRDITLARGRAHAATLATRLPHRRLGRASEVTHPSLRGTWGVSLRGGSYGRLSGRARGRGARLAVVCKPSDSSASGAPPPGFTGS